MRRGEIRVVDFRGWEASKRRPAVIVSNDGANAVAARNGRGVITVLPITSNVRRINPFQVRLPAAASGLRQDSSRPEDLFGWPLEAVGELAELVLTEGDGWVNWSGLATLLGEVNEALANVLDRLRARRYAPTGQ